LALSFANFEVAVKKLTLPCSKPVSFEVEMDLTKDRPLCSMTANPSRINV
jgi:hypothetical protein